MDCVGLLVLVGLQTGLSDYDVMDYRRNTNGFDFLAHLIEAGFTRKPLVLREPGDVLAFRDGNYPCHVAILSDKHREEHIIHSSAKARKVLEEPYTNEWPKKVVMCLAWPGVE